MRIILNSERFLSLLGAFPFRTLIGGRDDIGDPSIQRKRTQRQRFWPPGLLANWSCVAQDEMPCSIYHEALSRQPAHILSYSMERSALHPLFVGHHSETLQGGRRGFVYCRDPRQLHPSLRDDNALNWSFSPLLLRVFITSQLDLVGSCSFLGLKKGRN